MTDSVPTRPTRSSSAPRASLDPGTSPTLQTIMSAQRPAVVAHIRRERRRSPKSTPAEIIGVLEKHYLAAVTVSGASVGAVAAVPAVGVIASLTLSGVETVAFLEASALFAQSVAEVHGIAVDDPERAHALVMALILGGSGRELVAQFTRRLDGASATAPWGEALTRSLPQAALDSLVARLRRIFARHFAARQSGTILGRALPFGIGAAIGGAANNALGRRIVRNAREAFGPAPDSWPSTLS